MMETYQDLDGDDRCDKCNRYTFNCRCNKMNDIYMDATIVIGLGIITGLLITIGFISW